MYFLARTKTDDQVESVTDCVCACMPAVGNFMVNLIVVFPNYLAMALLIARLGTDGLAFILFNSYL